MNNKYIVFKEYDCWESILNIYIQKVISYKRNKFQITLDINKAHKYKTEKTAIKAAQNFNGEIKLV
jgi:hypothetical protein